MAFFVGKLWENDEELWGCGGLNMGGQARQIAIEIQGTDHKP